MIFTENKKLFHWRRVKRNKKEYAVCKQVLVYTAFGLGASAVQAGPTGGEITSGSGSITQSDTTTDILQASKVLDINWETFSTLPDETVNFLQPNTMAVAINRVIGGVPSSLAGTLNANGRVFILNQAGIVFHQSSVVNVAGLLATTSMNLLDELLNETGDLGKVKKMDFDSVLYIVPPPPQGDAHGEVINEGEINISDGGFAILAAPYVQNTGFITANLGQIHLASTNTFTLDLRGDGLITFSIPEESVQQIETDGKAIGVDNSGTLQAQSGIVSITSKTASDLITGAINLTGVIDATSFGSGHDGGSVQLVSAGDINIKNGAQILADGGVNGDGGEIVTWADGVNTFKAGASLSARGGDEAGDGGFIELSGNTVKVRGSDIDAGAPNGLMGIFLIDPDVITISQGSAATHTAASGTTGGALTSGSPSISAGAVPSNVTVYENTIETIAGNGTLVTLEANNLITMEDLSVVSGTNTAAVADGILDVGSGGITMRILDDADNVGRIEFQNPNNTIRSTTGNITLEVNGTNGAGTGAEIEVGNIISSVSASGAAALNTASTDVINAGAVNIISDGEIIAGNITVNTTIINPTLPPLTPANVLTTLNVDAESDITINGDINVNATFSDDTALLGQFDVDAVATLTAGSGTNSGSITINGNFNLGANANLGTSANIGTGVVDGTATLIAANGISVTGDMNVIVDVTNSGGNAGAHEGSVFLTMNAGTGGPGDLEIVGNVNVKSSTVLANPIARAVALASADITNASGDVIISGTSDTDGVAGIEVTAFAENGNNAGDDPGRADADAILNITASSSAGSAVVNIASNVGVTATAIMQGDYRSPAFADATATINAQNDVTIGNDLSVQAITDMLLNTGTTGGSGLANATLTVNAGTGTGTVASSADTGNLSVGGMTEVIASNTKDGGVGKPVANAVATLNAANDITLDEGIRVNALNNVVNAVFNTNDFSGASALADLDINAGTGSDIGRLDIGSSGVEVIASNQISGTAASTVNVVASANGLLTAWNDIEISDSTNVAGITVQGIANNPITGAAIHTADADAHLTITAGGAGGTASTASGIAVFGNVLVSADADKTTGNGGVNASATAAFTAPGNININTGGVDVLAAGNATSATTAVANAGLAAQSLAGSVTVDNSVTVEATASANGGSGDALASASVDMDAFSDINIGGALTVAGLANLGSNAASGRAAAVANANLLAGTDTASGGNVTIGSDMSVSASANNLGTGTTNDADASATLTMAAGGAAGSNTGTITVAGDLLVAGNATLANASTANSMNANAAATLTAGNDILLGTNSTAVATGVSVTAMANGSAGSLNDVVAAATLSVDAGNNVTGTGTDTAVIDIGGAVLVSADADQVGSFAPSALVSGDASANFVAPNDITVDGDISVMANAFRNAGGVGSSVRADADLIVNAGTAASVNSLGDFRVTNSDINVVANATASSGSGSTSSPLNVNADASADIDAFGEININGFVNVDANAIITSAVGGSSVFAYGRAWADLEAGSNVIIAGSVDVTALASNLASASNTGSTNDAFAVANLDIDAGTGGSASTGSVSIGSNLTVNATAILGSNLSGTQNSASALAFADVISRNAGISVTGDVTVAALAQSDAANGNQIYGIANLFMNAASTATGVVDYDLVIGGDLSVTATASNNSASANNTATANAYADAYLIAANDIAISSTGTATTAVNVSANATLNSANSNTGNGYGAYAEAYLTVHAGQNGSSGSFTVTGDMVIAATGTMTGTAGSDRTAYANTWGYLAAFDSITIDGNLTVMSDADQNATGSDLRARAFSHFYGSAGTGSPAAAGDFSITGNFLASADASLINGTSFGGEASGDLNAYIGAYRDIDIDGNFTVDAKASIASDMSTAYGFDADAEADGTLYAGRNITVDGSVAVTADAQSLAGASSSSFGGYASADADLFVYAGALGSGNIDIGSVTPGLTVSANANLPHAYGDADATAQAYMIAANDIDVTGDLMVTAVAVATATGTKDVDAEANAYINMYAGVGSAGTGSITINSGNMLVSADADVVGGFGNAQAYADAYMSAYNDITVDGNLSVVANAFGTDQHDDEDNEAIADFFARAGLASSANLNTANGFGDFTINGDVLVSASAEQLNFSAGTSLYANGDFAPFAEANIFVSANRDINISGSVDVLADATFTQPSTVSGLAYGVYGAAYVEAFASADFEAGRNVTIGGDINAIANALNSVDVDVAYAGAQAVADIEIDAGLGFVSSTGTASTGFVDIGGNILASADARFNADATYGYAGPLTPYGGFADAYASVDVESRNDDITVDGDVDVIAFADNQGDSSSYASAGAYLHMDAAGSAAAGTADSFDLTIGGDVNVEASANIAAGAYGNDAYAYANAFLQAANNINISSTGTASNAINVTAFGSNVGAYVAGDASADAILLVDAGNGGSSGSISVTGSVNVNAEAQNSGSITESAIAISNVDFVAYDGITITGDMTVTALANALISTAATTASEGRAFAFADLDMNAGTGSTGSLLVTGDMLVSADADATSATEGAYAYAHATLTAANDVTVSGTDGIQVLADALITSGIDPSGASAQAYLTINAGTHSVNGDIDVTGPVTVTANAVQNGTSATATGAIATANVLMTAWNNITIGDDVLVSANATNNATGVGGTNNLNADADAILTMNAGTGGTSGSITISGNVNNTAIADLNNDSASTVISANANAQTALTAFDDITITGFLNVLGSASVASGLGGTPATVNAVGLATADLDAGGNVDIDSFVAITANAVNSGTATMNNQATASAQFLVNAGTQGSGNITIGTSLAHTVDVMANAFLSSNASGSVANSVSALANMNMAATSGSVVVAGDVTVTASADNDAQTGDAATASALLVVDAGVAGTGDLDINLQGDVLVQSVADIANNNTANSNLARVLSSVDLDAAGDIIISDVSTDATAVQVIATANNNGIFGNGATASALALVNMNAGDDGTGSLIINAESNNALLVTADANKTGTATTASAVAVADVDLIAATDITLDGNVVINANADNTAVATVNNADADATFTVNAGQDFVMTSHDINMNVTVPLNTGTGTAAAFGSIDIDAGRDILLTNVDTDLFVTGSAGTGATSADVMATANQDFEAGRHITHTGTVNVVATAINEASNGSFARANATLNMDAGSTATGDLTFNGTMRVIGQAQLLDGATGADVTANGTANLFAADSIDLTVGTGSSGIVVAGFANSIIFPSVGASPSAAPGLASTAVANATLNVDAGNGSNAGSGNITQVGDATVVTAANSGLGTSFVVNNLATGAANMNYRAFNDIDINGTLIVSAAANALATTTAANADADAHFLASAGTGSTNGSIQLGSASNDVVDVDAVAMLSSGTGSANADADVTLNAWNDIRLDSDVTVDASASADGTSPDAVANADFIASAGRSSTSGSFINNSHDITITAMGQLGSGGANVTARAGADIDAWNDIIFGDTAATATTANLTVFAQATKPSSATASGTADGDAVATFNAGDNISFYGTINIDGLATASASSNPAFALGSLNMVAGSNGTGNIFIDGGSIDIDANASAVFNSVATANANANFTAANDITLLHDITVFGGAVASSSNATANAAMTMTAGTQGTGNITIVNSNTLVTADADAGTTGSAVANGNASMTLTAANNIETTITTLNVIGRADAPDSNASANAILTMIAGVGSASTGYITVTNTTTLVSADADADSATAVANATATMTAANDINVIGGTLSVLGNASGVSFSSGNAMANATLTMNAGVGASSSGSILVSNSATLVSADADGSASFSGGNATANATATMTAANDIDIIGGTLSVLSAADGSASSGGNASANATLTMNAGVGASSSGSILVSNSATLVSASADGNAFFSGGNANANATATMTAANDIDIIGGTLRVLGAADGSASSGGNASANATLTMNAGTSSSGNILFSNNVTLVSATAYGNAASSGGDANATATATMTAANDIEIIGGTFDVLGEAYGNAGILGGAGVGNATLNMTAGTSSSGSILVSNSATRVAAYGYGGAPYGGTGSANAAVNMTAANDIDVIGGDLLVEAFGYGNAFVGGYGNATATLNMTAGTSSSGSILVSNDETRVYASAYGQATVYGSASANATATMTAANSITISGGSLNVLGDAEAYAFIGGYGNANASLTMIGGSHSSGSILVSNNATRVSADADGYAIYGGGGNANATMTMTAADNINFTGGYLVNGANANGYALVGYGSATANATMNLTAGTHSSSGSILMSNSSTRVDADALGYGYLFGGHANANAMATMNAAGDINVTGGYLRVLGDATGLSIIPGPGSSNGNATANATLTMAAGLHSSGSILISNSATIVSADAHGIGAVYGGNASANATMTLNAANNIEITGGFLSVLGEANGNAIYGGAANANATLTMIGGSHSSGSILVSNSATRVLAEAYGNAVFYGSGTANATLTMNAANDIDVTDGEFSVQAYGYGDAAAGGYGNAMATLNITAGTHSSSGSINMSNSATRVAAYGYGDAGAYGNANATANATLQAAEDINITAGVFEVVGIASGNANVYGGSATANATLTMNAGLHGLGNILIDNSSTRVSASADGDAYGSGDASANATVTLAAANDIDVVGGSLQVLSDADGFIFGSAATGGNATANATLTMNAGTAGTGSIMVDNSSVDVSASADGFAHGNGGTANATATATITAPDSIEVNSPLNVTAGAYGAADNTGSGANANATLTMTGSSSVAATDTIEVSAYAYGASASGGFASGNAVATVIGSNDVDLVDLDVMAFGGGNGTANANATGTLNAGLTLMGNINVDAEAINSYGPTGAGNASANASLTGFAGSEIDMDAVTVDADALCSGSTGSCNPVANAAGTFTAPGDIVISGPINVLATSIANNTGTTANASANLNINAGGDLRVGDTSAIGSAFINHSGVSALAVAFGSVNLNAGSSVTVGDVNGSGNAINSGSSGSATGSAFVIVTAGGGDILINGGIVANAGLVSPGGTNGTALGSINAAGSNVAGAGFQTPRATAGPAEVISLSTVTETVGNSTATLIINPTIVTDNELTLRMALTNLEASGFLLPTGIGTYPGGGNNGDGTDGSNPGFRNGTPRGIVFNLPDGAGTGGFSVDANGNVVFTPSFGGLPQNAVLPLPFDICDLATGDTKQGGIVNCGWNNEPVFY